MPNEFDHVHVHLHGRDLASAIDETMAMRSGLLAKNSRVNRNALRNALRNTLAGRVIHVAGRNFGRGSNNYRETYEKIRGSSGSIDAGDNLLLSRERRLKIRGAARCYFFNRLARSLRVIYRGRFYTSVTRLPVSR